MDSTYGFILFYIIALLEITVYPRSFETNMIERKIDGKRRRTRSSNGWKLSQNDYSYQTEPRRDWYGPGVIEDVGVIFIHRKRLHK